MRLLTLCCLLLIAATPTHARAADEFSVAVTIKPLHALVAGVMKGAGSPALVMGGSASPHHYTLRPSERRMLGQAALVFWIGPQLESFMPRILSSLDASTTSVALIEANGLTRLPATTTQTFMQTSIRISGCPQPTPTQWWMPSRTRSPGMMPAAQVFTNPTGCGCTSALTRPIVGYGTCCQARLPHS